MLVHDPAIRQPEIAVLGETLHLVHGSVIQAVFSIGSESILRDAYLAMA